MNTTLTAIIIALLSGTAINEFMANDVEAQVSVKVSSLIASQQDQAEQLADVYGLDLTPSEAWDHFYGEAK